MPELKITISNLNIAYRTWGNPANPPIIALHGWLDNANSFEALAEQLEAHYYILAIDFPGHGHSDHLPEISNYHFIDAVFISIKIIEALNFKKVHLIGHSLGACVASIIGGVAPQLLLTLTLIEGLGPLSYPEQSACAQLQNYLNFIKRKHMTSRGYADLESAAQARSLKGYLSQELSEKLCERGLKKEDDLLYWRHDKKLLFSSPLRMTEQQVISCLKEIEVRTFLIWGDQGFNFDTLLMQKRMEAVKHLQVASLKGGHHVHMEQAQQLASLLFPFYQYLEE